MWVPVIYFKTLNTLAPVKVQRVLPPPRFVITPKSIRVYTVPIPAFLGRYQNKFPRLLGGRSGSYFPFREARANQWQFPGTVASSGRLKQEFRREP